MDIQLSTELIAAIAALGTSAQALVEAAKWTPLGRMGVATALHVLGPIHHAALVQVYGEKGLLSLLEGSFRAGPTEFAECLRNGLRTALIEAPETFQEAGATGRPSLVESVAVLRTRLHTPEGGSEPAPEDVAAVDEARGVLGRHEMVIDGRVTAAVSAARHDYDGAVRLTSIAVSVVGGILGALSLSEGISWRDVARGAFVGVLAVPLAPIANELVGLLQNARGVLRTRSNR